MEWGLCHALKTPSTLPKLHRALYRVDSQHTARSANGEASRMREIRTYGLNEGLLVRGRLARADSGHYSTGLYAD